MTTHSLEALRAQAAAIVRDNDRGAYTVPTKGLYPFQWNWDSCLVALGWARLDEDRAWSEIEALFSALWVQGGPLKTSLLGGINVASRMFPQPRGVQTAVHPEGIISEPRCLG